MLKLVEENYSLDDIIADYKKAYAAIKGDVVVESKGTVLGKTGGRNVPIIKHHDIKSRLTESMAASAGSAVTSNLVQF
jgi:RNase P/RNase MRP subunit p29